ncbi:hypothetical protein BKA65DRAFT_510575 [Rhexocercosporidium sp. MPI-PUGE-AT-0058]|nr:hypothetical protein BKA65DRAFT_510575 [Rhexocercosporidium sp. MPI-PUGE-AT-0058]
MKVNTAFTLATMAIGIIAEPVIVGRGTPVERDVPAITNVLNAVGSGLSALDAAVNSFSGDAADLDSKAAALVSTINGQAATVPSSGALTFADAIALAGPVTALQTVGQALVNDLIAKKSAFEAARLCSDLASITTSIKTASSGLIDAIVALVPIDVQPVAISLAAPFNAALADGVAAYAAGNCVDAPSTTTSSTAPGTTTSASETTSSSATTASVSETASASDTTSSSTPTKSGVETYPAASSTSSKPSVQTYPAASYPSKSSVVTLSTSSCTTSASAGASMPSSVYVAGPYPTVTKPSSPGSSTGVIVKPTTSAPVTVTGGASMNQVARSICVLALAAVALAL